MDLGEGSYRLTIDEGISLAPEGSSRLPILGLRALVKSGLVLNLHGKRCVVSIKTPGWFG